MFVIYIDMLLLCISTNLPSVIFMSIVYVFMLLLTRGTEGVIFGMWGGIGGADKPVKMGISRRVKMSQRDVDGTLQLEPISSRVYSKGQVTIPAKIRKRLNIDEGTVLSFLQIGEVILLSPRRLAVPGAQTEMAWIMEEEGVTLQELLRGLEEERVRYNREEYGKQRIKDKG